MASPTPVLLNHPEDLPAFSAEIAVDESFDGSDYAESWVSDTTSLKSSILDYVYENGRRYHRYSEGKYLMPNDETEQDRLDMYHHICLLRLNGHLHLSPLRNPQRILDIGTGTGIWAMDAAETYPSAEVIGTDLSAIQPVWVPPNVSFQIDDAECDWTFPPDHFDLIHSRTLLTSIRDWPKYLRQMFKHTRPGGYTELVEGQAGVQSDDNSIPKDSAILKLFRHWATGAQQLGITLVTGDILKQHALDAGFVDVQVYTLKQPWSPWPKDERLKNIGSCMSLNCETAFAAHSLAMFTRVLGMSREAAATLCEGALGDAKNRKMHIYNYAWYVVARKPLAGEKD